MISCLSMNLIPYLFDSLGNRNNGKNGHGWFKFLLDESLCRICCESNPCNIFTMEWSKISESLSNGSKRVRSVLV